MTTKSFFIVSTFLFMLCTACNPSTVLGDDDTESTDGNTSDEEDNDALQTEAVSDFVWDNTDVASITLNGTSISSSSTNVTISGSTATITSGGYYSISGTLSNGQIVVKADSGIVKIQLNNASLTNTSSSPLYIKKAKKAVFFLADGTTNSVTDASSYSNSDEPNAAIFSNDYLGFTGTGALSVKGNYNDGISSDDQIIINNGQITVNAKDDAIRGKDYLLVKDGTITATASTGHALKSDNADDNGYGYVKITGGTLNLTSTSGDGIHGVKRSIVNGGTLNISAASSQGLKSDSLVIINGGNTNIKSSREGIESPYITVTDGTLTINASDDGFNASKGNGGESNDGSLLTINGGDVAIFTTTGDAIDSNGNIGMTGGTVIAHGPKSQPEVGLDYNGTFNITGGFLVVSGIYSSNMTQATSTSSSQCALKIVSGGTTSGGGMGGMGSNSGTTLSSTTLIHVEDASGNNLLTFQPNKSYSSILFSSSSLKKNASYNIYTGGTSTGTVTNGLYSGGTYSGGTLKSTTTVSSSVTTISF